MGFEGRKVAESILSTAVFTERFVTLINKVIRR